MHAEDLSLALRLADIADEISMQHFRSQGLETWTKPDRTFVTAGDRAVELALRERLQSERPEDGILGEEFGTEGSGARQWIIDPIDGTRSYLAGREDWCVCVALVEDQRSIMAAVYAPSTDEFFLARQGQGTTCNGRPVQSTSGIDL